MNKKFMANVEIRAAAKGAGVPLWMVAEEIGLSDSSFSRLLRHELTDRDREDILAIIKRLTSERG